MIQNTLLMEIINIGDELLNGTAVNTNATWMCSQGVAAGAEIVAVTMIGDQPGVIREALERASQRANLVMVTGGLGPTVDDRTRDVALEFFGGQLIPDYLQIERIRQLFAERDLPLTPRNEQQGWVPDTAIVLSNPVGTAPGMEFHRAGVTFVFLPGVPMEMKRIIQDNAARWFPDQSGSGSFVYGEMMVVGVGESFVADTLQSWETKLPEHLTLAYLPSAGLVRVRLSCRRVMATDHPEAEITQWLEEATRLFPDHALLTMGDTLEQHLIKVLADNHSTISTAESCTGGFLAHKLTSVPGSSAVYKGSVVAYHNEVKIKLLGVKQEVIEVHGAVSREVVEAMALAIRAQCDTTFGVATSGIAGPDGGTPEKPVGTVWIAVAGPQGVVAEKFLMGTDRIRNIEKTATTAMVMLLKISKLANVKISNVRLKKG